MDDRTLLELAAKAAGYGDHNGNVCWTQSEYPKGSGRNGALWNYKGHMDTAELWNPLSDDGDAFRLAVKLNMSIYLPVKGDMPGFVTVDSFEGYTLAREPIKLDTLAATRRAIVRAAAAIGEGNG